MHADHAPEDLPALSLAAVPGRRLKTLELAGEIERRGFTGIYCPSFGDGLTLCSALAFHTHHIPFGTSITPIYTRQPADFAQAAAFIHETSGGRFRFGIGVSHEPAMSRLGIRQGKPLADIRAFVEALRAVPRSGDLPPIILATLRDRMITLAGTIGDGMVFANGARSHMQASLAALPEARRNDPRFFIGNMIPTCLSEDIAAAAAINRRTLTGYVQLPNYRNYWRAAGYAEEMDAIETALAAGDTASLPALMSDRWLADCTYFGPASGLRDAVAAWREAGIRTPILVPSSAQGGQLQAFAELFAAYA
jgi:alkanesulfonate monooxygenase SsuD/methylene tetrahydromethanopterin reductase-like flavin-dependent oxidoreductase (luciferase family)